jgi:Tim44-like domain
MADHPDEFLNSVERVEEHLLHRHEIAEVKDKLIDLGEQEVDGIVKALKDRTPARLPGVDTSAIKQVDPEFDDETFRAIARETFFKVREARTLQNPEESAELLSPQMQGEMQTAISGELASHRHHLLPLLSLSDAVIASAEVVAGHEEIGVRFSIVAAEEDVDDRTHQVLAGDSSEHSWDELWRFVRDPQAHASANDERHETTLVAADQWMVAHRGWVVTEIERLNGA